MSPSRSLATVFLVKSNFSPQFFTIFQCSNVQQFKFGWQTTYIGQEYSSQKWRENIAVVTI